LLDSLLQETVQISCLLSRVSWYLCVGRAKKGVRRVAKGFKLLSFRRNCDHISPLATSKSKKVKDGETERFQHFRLY